MSVFLGDAQLGQAIRQLTTGSDLRCAVAFWGNGAATALFGETRPPAESRLICDISMGGSNPKVLAALGAPDNANLRHVPGLHAKVYLSDQGLITCSANASDNGIGFIDVAKLVEAGTLHPPGSEPYKQAADWFEHLWVRSSQIDQAALDLADRNWRQQRRARDERLGRPPNPESLLDIVAAAPEKFRGVGFVFTSGATSTEQRNRAVEAVADEHARRGAPAMPKPELAALAAWNVGDVFSEWSPEDVRAWPQLFVCADKEDARFAYWFYERIYTAVTEDGHGIVLAKRRRALRRELGFRSGRAKMAQVDHASLQSIFHHLGVDGRRLCESGQKLIELLAACQLIE